MLNLIQHLTKSKTYETLKRPMKQVQGMVQGDRLGLFTSSSLMIGDLNFHVQLTLAVFEMFLHSPIFAEWIKFSDLK